MALIGAGAVKDCLAQDVGPVDCGAKLLVGAVAGIVSVCAGVALRVIIFHALAIADGLFSRYPALCGLVIGRAAPAVVLVVVQVSLVQQGLCDGPAGGAVKVLPLSRSAH